MYTLFLKNPAKKFLKKIDPKERERILNKIEELKENPRIGFPLSGNFAGLMKLRIGKYRALYKIKDDKLIIVILDIGNRRNIYN